MVNATSALVDKDFTSIISNKTRHYKMAAKAVHSKNHITQERDTKETLQVLFLCKIKRVAFIVGISNRSV